MMSSQRVLSTRLFRVILPLVLLISLCHASRILSPSTPFATSSPGCAPSSSWSFTIAADSVSVSHVDRSSCLAIVRTAADCLTDASLIAVSLVTGLPLWTLDLVGESIDEWPITASLHSPGTLYLSTANLTSDCSLLRAVAYGEGTAVKVLWTTALCGVASPTVLAVPFSSAEILVVLGGAWWVSLDAASGVVLRRESAPVSGWLSVTVSGDPSDGLFTLFPDETSCGAACSVLTYETQPTGHWRLRGNVTYDGAQWRALDYSVVDHTHSPVGRTGRVLPLQQSCVFCADRWSGWDLLTGARLWSVQDDPLLTGDWATASPGFQTDSGSVTFAVHPLDGDALLVSAFAYNASSAVRHQYGVLDLRSGKVALRSAVTAPRLESRAFVLTAWTAVGVSTLVTDEGDGQFWRAVDAATLATTGSGALTRRSDTHGYVAITNGSAALWSLMLTSLSGTLESGERVETPPAVVNV